MKQTRIYPLLAMLSLMVTAKAFSQNFQLFAIEPFCLEITCHKTVTIIFPAAIENIELGSQQVLARPANKVKNILYLKVANKEFTETNLTVVTSAAELYTFILSYADAPQQLTFELIDDQDDFLPSAAVKRFNPIILRRKCHMDDFQPDNTGRTQR